MKRKTSDLPTVVYTYGVHMPDDHQSLIDTLYLANKYRNQLIELELNRRKSDAALLSQYGTVGELEQRIAEITLRKEALYAEKIARPKPDRRTPFHGDATMKELKETLKGLYVELKAAKATARTELAPKRAELWDSFYEDYRTARGQNNLYWGTYLQVESAFEKSAKSLNPRFKRFDGTGTLAVQVQKSVSIVNLFQIPEISPRVWSLPRGERKKATLVNCRMRIGSDEKRKPIWLDFKVRWHRPLPSDSLIKWVKLHRIRIGNRFKWELHLSVEHARPAQNNSVLKNVGIDLGCRRLPDGRMRMGYMYDYLGEDQEIVVNERNISALKHADSLVSIREREFNGFKPVLLEWYGRTNDKAEWITEALAEFSHWKSPRRLSKLAFRWRNNRFDGDEEIYAKLEAWRKQDLHLWDWEASERVKTYRRRRDEYRNIAADIAKNYDVVYLEDINLQDVMTDDSGKAEQRYLAAAVAVGEFRTILKNACDSRGTRLVKVVSAKICTVCRSSLDSSDRELIQTCGSCKSTWDQDANSARNIRESGARHETTGEQKAA